MHRSFRCQYNGIAINLVIDAEISSIDNNKRLKIDALWDTGLNQTMVCQKIINKLNLEPVGDGFLDTISDEKVPSKIYIANLFLPGGIDIPNIKVTGGDPKGCDVLIGMDIISQGDFAVSNFNGKTTFVFRKPSAGEFSYEPIKSEKTGRNDTCPCGSGRKYKQCCNKGA